MNPWTLLPPAGAAHQISMDDGTDSTFPNFGPSHTYWWGPPGFTPEQGPVGHPRSFPPAVTHPAVFGADFFPPAVTHPAVVGDPSAQAAAAAAIRPTIIALLRGALAGASAPRHSPAPRSMGARSRFGRRHIPVARRDLLAALLRFND